ncbi:XisI protein [Spirulina sp. 06S082]|uniref:XisI protein n=1 Tax=Spirulina sp. 06S082 TaxID=3110248 RepID=UPI002B1F2F7E|nr:XisI protein [Spirulina sp. 06S082]MEA5469947.1 XisI protein [Spirulina sp. 06S082]
MDTLDRYRNILEDILQKYANLPYRYGDVTTTLIINRNRDQFVLMDEGWQEDLRVHGVLVHAEIRNEKIWIHRDGIEEGITPELLEAGIPKEDIVLAFHAPDVRQYTEFAIN